MHNQNLQSLWLESQQLFAEQKFDRLLDTMVLIYNHPLISEEDKTETLQYILNMFYYPNQQVMAEKLETNRKWFDGYRWSFHDFAGQSYSMFADLCIPRNDDSCYFFSCKQNRFSDRIDLKYSGSFSSLARKQCVLAALYSPKDLILLHEKTNNGRGSPPIYLIWENQLQVLAALHLYEYQTIVANGRFVFFSVISGLPDSLSEFLKDPSSYLPSVVFCNSDDDYRLLLQKHVKIMCEFREAQLRKNIRIAHEYCKNFNRNFYQRLLAGPSEDIRILFWTSRYTTAVQYITRHCHEACLNVGYESALLLEEDDLHACYEEALIAKIAEFQPHMIFRINFPRSVFPKVPHNLIWIMWAMDHFITQEMAAAVKPFDVFIVMGNDGVKQFLSMTGVAPHQVHNQVYAVNLEPADRGNQLAAYTADVAFVSHVGDIDYGIEQFLKFADLAGHPYKEYIVRILTAAVEKYIEIFEKESFAFDPKRFRDLVVEISGSQNTIYFHDHVFPTLHREIGNRITKLMAVKWLFEAGFDVRVWGNEWVRLEWAKSIAMGPASKDELKRIYSSSQIGLSVLSTSTLQQRTLEMMSYGGFCLVAYIPEEQDGLSIKNCFVENEDFVFFYNRKDLLNKVDYYLKHEGERKRIAENGREKVYAKHSYSQAMDNILHGVCKTVSHAGDRRN